MKAIFDAVYFLNCAHF